MFPLTVPRRAVPVAAVFLLLALASGHAQAQPLQAVTLTMTAEPASLTLAPGATGTSTITLTNGGNAPGQATLTVDGTAAGWTATIDPAQVQVPAGGSATATLTVVVAATRDGTASAFAANVNGQIADTVTGTQTATATVPVNSQLTAAPPPPPPAEFPWIPVLLGLLVIAGIAAYLLMRRAENLREDGIELLVPKGESEARAGIDVFVPIEVRNTSDRPRIAKLTTEAIPFGWAAGTNLTSVSLDPGQSQALWLAVRAPIDSPPTQATLAVTARPAEARKAKPGLPVPIRVVTDMRTVAALGAHGRAGGNGEPSLGAQPGDGA